ncbi:CBS domain-containing protein [Patescibacteria group bacterium]|nr:CBS domain-containing protein [Patescibacteria group bacterium]MCL5091846.1 CBS domain-containing protein [Patescibacteria group bacterium]
MLYFSEIKGKKIYTEDGVLVGKLEDLIFQASSLPRLTKLVVRTVRADKIFVDINCLQKINGGVVINKKYNLGELVENELFLVKNLLDKQIIDLKGHKVIRVNDVVIQDKEGWYISGVDVGALAILRWLKLDKLIEKIYLLVGLHINSRFLSWGLIQPLELGRGKVKLKKREETLHHIHSEDLADYLEKTNIRNARKFLDTLDDRFSASVIENLNFNFQTAIFASFTPDKAARALEYVDGDEAVDILLSLPAKKRRAIISLLSDAKKQEIMYLLDLSKTPIGQLVSSEFLAVESDLTAREIVNLVHSRTSDYSFLSYVYVVNKDRQLVGVFNLHELLLQSPDTPVSKFMVQNVVVIHLSTPEEIAIKKMLKYKIYSLPVINRDKHILGLVTYDDVTNFILERLQ